MVFNVGDWRQRQEEYLLDLADESAKRALETGEPQHLYNLNAGQRRVIHLSLAEKKDIETTSEGEGRERYLVIRPAS